MRPSPSRKSSRGPCAVRGLSLLLAGICCWRIDAVAQSIDPPPPAYEVNAAVDGEFWRNSSGGLAVGNRFLDHGLISLAINGEKAFGIPGLSAYSSAVFTNGHHINGDLVGSAQGISNIEAIQVLRLLEAWTEWQYGGGDNSLRFGLYDVNSEFDAIDTASLFINPSHGIGPDFSQSGQNGPSIFPVTSLALRSRHQRGPWTLQLAALDGVPGDPEHPQRSTIRFGAHDGLLLLAETAYESDAGVRAAAGYWRYTAKFADLIDVDAHGDAVERSDNHGYYALVDMRLCQQQDQHPGVNAYVRVGKANPHINPIESYLGAGIVMSGTLPGRDKDQLGLAIGIAGAGHPFRDTQAAQSLDTTRQERIAELTYFLPITGWLSLQPDIQYVEHAAFDATLRHSWVFGLRFELSAAVSK